MLNPLPALPNNIPTVDPAQATAVETYKNQPAYTGGQEKGGTFIAKTLKELRVENAELTNQLVAEAQTAVSAKAETAANAAVEAERKRMAEIDGISSLYDNETVREAKYVNPCSAQEMTYRAAQKTAMFGKSFMSDILGDCHNSGANDVPAAPEDMDKDCPPTPKQRMTLGSMIAQQAMHKS